FAFASFSSGLVAIVGLNALNPDALIVRTNVARPRFDAVYNSALSADAVPILISSLPSVGDTERTVVAGCLLQRWGGAAEPDWRTWNLARPEARQLVRTDLETLGNPAAVGGGRATVPQRPTVNCEGNGGGSREGRR